MSAERIIRIFISSTFRDFGEERDLLVRKVFPELRRQCRERQVELVDVDLRWGVTEQEAQQGKVLPICLVEIERARPFFMGLLGERYGWVPDKEQFDQSLLLEQPWLKAHRGGRSVTEFEILHGVLNNPKMAGRAFFYFRDPKWSKRKGNAYRSEGPEHEARLKVLKDRIRKSGFPVVENYPTPTSLADRVKEDLWKLIDEAYPAAEVPDALTLERRRHEAYGAVRLRMYLGGKKYFQSLDAALGARRFRPVLVTGASGGGKSALLANWVAQWSRNHPKAVVIVHHLGCGGDAADPVKMATRLMQELARVTGETFKPESEPEKQLEQLPQWLARASAWARRVKRQVILVLDGLDKVSDRRHLRWFPSNLPAGVKLVASCLAGEIQQAAKDRLQWQDLAVKPLTKAEQRKFIKTYLGRFRKTLTLKQIRQVQEHELSGNPLFLLMVLEELRVFGVHEELDQRLNTLLSPPPSKAKGEPPTVDDVFEHILARVEGDISPKAVRGVMEALWASRAGLFQDELLAIAKVAPAQWAEVRNALDESLYEDRGRIRFGHDYLGKAVEDRYALTVRKQRRLHRQLAKYFEGLPVDRRVAEELPWQWEQAGEREQLRTCLTGLQIFRTLKNLNKYELLGYWVRLGADVNAAYEAAWEVWQLEGKSRIDTAHLLASFLQTAGYYSDFAASLARSCMEAREADSGPEHPDTLDSVNNLAVTLAEQGNYAGAEVLNQRALAGREKRLGPEHPDTLHSVNNLANLMADQGDYAGAEVLYRRALAGKEKVLGPEHPDTLDSVYNLAVILRDRGDYAGAEVLYQRALAGREKVLGPEHPDTLHSVNNLANLMADQGDYAGAEVLCRRALAGREKVLGPEHPDTLDSVNNLAVILRDRGDYAGAEVLDQRALAGREKRLGPEHPDTLDSVNNLAVTLAEQGNYAGAEVLYKRSLAGRETVLGPEHPNTLSSVNNLAMLLRERGDYAGAEPLLRRALAGQEKVLGPEHPKLLVSVNNLAILLAEQGNYAGAE
jgi:nephrocystin-3